MCPFCRLIPDRIRIAFHLDQFQNFLLMQNSGHVLEMPDSFQGCLREPFTLRKLNMYVPCLCLSFLDVLDACALPSYHVNPPTWNFKQKSNTNISNVLKNFPNTFPSTALQPQACFWKNVPIPFFLVEKSTCNEYWTPGLDSKQCGQ